MSSYSEFANAASRILQHEGDVQGRATANKGELIGGTIAQLGQVIPQQVQQAMKQAAQQRKQKQITDIFADPSLDMPSRIQKVYQVDPEMGAKLGKEYGEAQKTTYELAKLQHDYEKSKIDYALNKLGSAQDESSWASAILGLKEAGEDVSSLPLHFSPDAVKQVNLQLLDAKDRLAQMAPRPPALEKIETTNEQGVPGTTFVTPTAGAFYPKTPAQTIKSEVDLARDAADPNSPTQAQSQSALDRLKPPKDTSLTPYQQAQLDLATKRLTLEQQRELRESQNTNEPLIPVMKDGKAVLVRRSQAEGMTPASTGKDEGFNQAQTTAAGYAKRIEHAESVLGAPEVEKAITNMGLLKFTAESHAPAKLQSTQFQQYDQASRNFINAILRRESGAAISQSEFDNAKRQYLPQPGDSAEALKLKRQNRKDALDALAKGASGAYTPDVKPATVSKKVGRFIVEETP